jgi:hypothetical protein
VAVTDTLALGSVLSDWHLIVFYSAQQIARLVLEILWIMTVVHRFGVERVRNMVSARLGLCICHQHDFLHVP